MESSTNKRALGLRDKLPDIEKTLDTVKFLKSRKVAASPFIAWRRPSWLTH